MRRLFYVLAALTFTALAAGCHSSSEGDAPPKISAAIDNNSAAAKSAPAAPGGNDFGSGPKPGGNKRATAPQN